MISLERVVEITSEEIANAFQRPIDKLIKELPPGTLLQNWQTIVSDVVLAITDAWFGLQRGLTLVAPKVAARVVSETANFGDDNQVCTLREAKRFAAGLCLGAVGEMGGTVRETDIPARASNVKGFKGRFASAEGKQILGRLLHRVFGLFRAPIALINGIVQATWAILSAIMAIGAVMCLYAIISRDWSEIALSQSRKRKRMKVSILRRI